IIYVLEGTWEYTVEGKPPVLLKSGGVLFIPAGAIHSARNVGPAGQRSSRRISSRKGSRSSRRWSDPTMSPGYKARRTESAADSATNKVLTAGVSTRSAREAHADLPGVRLWHLDTGGGGPAGGVGQGGE